MRLFPLSVFTVFTELSLSKLHTGNEQMDGSAVKSPCYLHGGSGFDSRHPCLVSDNCDGSFKDLDTSGFCGHRHSRARTSFLSSWIFVKPSHTNGHVEFFGISPKSLSLECIAVKPLIFGEATPVLLLHILVFPGLLSPIMELR